MPSLILFDGVCNVCNASVNFIIDHDPALHFKFASLQSDIGRHYLQKLNRSQTDFYSIILMEDGQIYEKSEAVLRIARKLSNWSWVWIFRFIPRGFRDALYRFFAKHRYALFGKKTTCRIPTDEERSRFLV